jgi:heme exporter protein A
VAGAPLLAAKGLSRRFGARLALDRVDLELFAGEAVAVFGPNGAGKTTLLRLLARSLAPSAGGVTLSGAADDLSARGAVGLLSHHSFLYDDLTALDNLVFFGKLYGVAQPVARARALLELTGLALRADDAVRTFSRGMQQRLALARALVHEPLVLLLDEPFSGLDPDAAGSLKRTLRAERAAGRALLMTTHDLSEGLELSDRWLFLSRGRVVASGASAGTERAALERAYREPPA